MSFGLKTNPSKTRIVSNVITGAVKPDKLDYASVSLNRNDVYMAAIQLHDFSLRWPNSGQTIKGLKTLNMYLKSKSQKINSSLEAVLAVIVDIACHSPRLYQDAFVVISWILYHIVSIDKKTEIIQKIIGAFSRYPHTHHMLIWLQRIVRNSAPHSVLDAVSLCQVVHDPSVKLWDSSFVSNKHTSLRKKMDTNQYFIRDVYVNLGAIIDPHEVNIFENIHSE